MMNHTVGIVHDGMDNEYEVYGQNLPRFRPDENGGKAAEWAMIELQGSLETRNAVSLSGRFIGDLHFTHKDVPVLIIGHHILYGKVVNLEKPYGVMVKDSTYTDDTQQTNYNVIAIIRKKLLFKTRPKPIIANVPKKL